MGGYGVSLRTQSKYGKIWTRKTPNTDTFQAVCNNCYNLFCSIWSRIYHTMFCFIFPGFNAGWIFALFQA